jgi:6-phosphogluconolactonase (cycloisomerase 2 family)
MTGPMQRRFSASVLGCALLLLIGCGNDSNSANNNGNTGTGTTGTTNGTPTTGGSNPVGTGGTGTGSGGTGTGSSSTSGTYLYAGVAVDTGAIRSFKVDTTTGALTELAGSPTNISQGFTTGGSLVTSKGFVYTVNRPGDLVAAAMYTFKADPSTGALSAVGNRVTVSPQNDADIRMINLSPDGNTAYLISQFNGNAVALNNGAPALLNTQPLVNGEVWGFAVAGKFAYAGIQEGNPKSGFGPTQIKRLSINSDGSLGPAQVIVTMQDTNLAYDLAADPTGKFVAATSGFNNDHVSVWSVNATTGNLTPVPGSPFASSTNIGKKLRFDPSGTHLYLVNNPDFEPRHEDVMVFSVASNGALTPAQTLDLGTGLNVTDFKVDNDFVYISNATGGGQSSIAVLKRDASSGQLSVVNPTTVSTSIGGLDSLHF